MTLLNIEQVSERTGLTPGTLRYFRHVNKGPKSGKIGRRVVYREEDVNSWIDASLEATSRGGNSNEVA